MSRPSDSEILNSALDLIIRKLSENSNIILVSTLVFALISMITHNLTRREKGEKTNVKKGPQPKWGILKFLNYVVLAIFVGSITYVGFNYKILKSSSSTASPLTNLFFPLMCLWTVCLAYFFGFFGISFLDTEEISSSPSSFGLGDLAEAAAFAEEPKKSTQSTTSSSQSSSLPSTSSPSPSTPIPTTTSSTGAPIQHPPRNETLICAERCAQAVARANPVHFPSPDDNIDYTTLSDEEIFQHLVSGNLKDYQLEKKIGDMERAVHLRRMLYEHLFDKKIDTIPYTNYDYNKVFGANCEIVIGYVPIPLGVVGPLVINGEPLYIPMATTEGCLVASTNRGCKAITSAGGCNAVVLKDAITRAPCVRFPSAMRAAALKLWITIPENYALVEAAFNSTTSYGRLESVEGTVAGRNVYLRFCCMSGDAMGMNMVSKGCLKAIELIQQEFPDMDLVAISGNMCTDKKPSAINWIMGRGKSVVVEAIIPDKIVSTILKSSVADMIETNKQKNHIGSAMAGSIGGFNAHAANIVTAVFLATGQDPAQNVESSNCLTIMEYAVDGQSLHVSVTMPSIEVGTVGGGHSSPCTSSLSGDMWGAWSLQRGGLTTGGQRQETSPDRGCIRAGRGTIINGCSCREPPCEIAHATQSQTTNF